MNIISDQFTRRFAPNCIDPNKLSPEIKQAMKDKGMMPISVILLDRVKDQVDKPITSHQLYYGIQGIGKSTVARIKVGFDVSNKLADWRDHEPLYVNCSKDASIDDLRGKIENFCTNAAFSDDGKIRTKVVFFDEIDGVRSVAFFDALRGFMDVYESQVKFIATCNHINRVPDMIKSRFNPVINFSPTNDTESKELQDKYAKRLKSVWSQVLKRNTSDEAIVALAKKTFPDMRSSLKALQVLFENPKVTDLKLENIEDGISSYTELYEFIFSKPDEVKIHEFLNIRYLDKGFDVIQDMHHNFVDYIISKHPDSIKLIGPVNIMAAEYQNAIAHSVDQFLCLKAYVYRLVQLLK